KKALSSPSLFSKHLTVSVNFDNASDLDIPLYDNVDYLQTVMAALRIITFCRQTATPLVEKIRSGIACAVAPRSAIVHKRTASTFCRVKKTVPDRGEMRRQ